MNDRKTVMISSTARDLPEHRDEVRDACFRAGISPDGMMEHLNARNAPAPDVSIEMVEKADVYIGIFAYRYGHVPDDSEISITEMEYNRAVELNKPRLLFFMHEEHAVTPKMVETGEGAVKLAKLKERAEKDRVSGFFKNADDLRAQVIGALSDLKKDLEGDTEYLEAEQQAEQDGIQLGTGAEEEKPENHEINDLRSRITAVDKWWLPAIIASVISLILVILVAYVLITRMAESDPKRSDIAQILTRIGSLQDGLDELANQRSITNDKLARARSQGTDVTELQQRKERQQLSFEEQKRQANEVGQMLQDIKGDLETRDKGVWNKYQALRSTVEEVADEMFTSRPNTPSRDCHNFPEMVKMPRSSHGAKHQSRTDISEEFYIGKYEVTRDQFECYLSEKGLEEQFEAKGCNRLVGGRFEWDPSLDWKNPGFDQSGNHPVVCVSWDDARAYAAWLSDKTGDDYRLPSEAEWEFAARAGTTTSYFWGEDIRKICDFANGLDQTGKKVVNAGFANKAAACSDDHAYTAPVGSFKANGFGLHNMVGNVWEWVDAPADDASSLRVLRGGSWSYIPTMLSSSSRDDRAKRDERSGRAGFRVVMTPRTSR